MSLNKKKIGKTTSNDDIAVCEKTVSQACWVKISRSQQTAYYFLKRDKNNSQSQQSVHFVKF